jgi:hypothetical protein
MKIFSQSLLLILISFIFYFSSSTTAGAQDQIIGLEPSMTPLLVAPKETIPTPVIPSDIVNDLSQEVSWLNDLYIWHEAHNLTRSGVLAQQSGAYCIGNGHSFALIGLESPLWDWSDLYGDSYQEPDLGSMQMGLTRNGVDITFSQQEIGWVRRSGVVKVKERGSGLTVETYDFAPCQWEREWVDNPPVLIRLVHITNQSAEIQSALELHFKIISAWNVKANVKTDKNDLIIMQKPTKSKKRTYWRMAAFDNRQSTTEDQVLYDPVPSLAPGTDTWQAYFLLSTDSPEEGEDLAQKLRSQGANNLLDDTHEYYQKWFQSGSEFSGDPVICDLFEIQSIIYQSEHSHSGGFSPLIGYSYTWIRDNNGPIRWFLKTGHPKEAKSAIDFFHGVASSMGSLPNSIRVDYPLTYKLEDLSHIHVEHAETPNWIILQYWWYYLTTGDLNTIRERWPYLKRCLTGQVQQEGKFFFHRDETYLWCLESRCFDYESYPNYDLSTYAFATDSSFDFVAAADRLVYLGGLLHFDVSDIKKMSEATRSTVEKTYWSDANGYWAPAQSLLGPLYNAPYANILINPFWCGYARNDLDPSGETPDTESKAVKALASGYKWLGKKDGFWKTTPSVNFFVGMNPGQLLYDLCKARLPWAEKAYKNVLEVASPSGDFSEMYDGDYLPWNPPVWGLGTSGRVRPWEGGLNTESLFEFLTGFTPDAGRSRVVFAPHLPTNCKQFFAERLQVKDSKISLELKRISSDAWQVVTRLDQGQTLEVVLDFWQTNRLINAVDTDGSVTWEKNPTENKGREAQISFNLAMGENRTFVIHEGAAIRDVEKNPPNPMSFDPNPYSTNSSDLLLLTTPSAVFSYAGHVQPLNFLKVGRSELELMNHLTPSVSFLDLDLPISRRDVVSALLDDHGNPKAKVAIWGRGAFSTGKHDFKPDSFWNDPQIALAVKNFLHGGGDVLIGPSYLDRENQPQWLVDLTHGGWQEGEEPGQVIAMLPKNERTPLKLMDEIDIANLPSESEHQVQYDGLISTDTLQLQELPRLVNKVTDDGRTFNGFYQFSAHTKPGMRHRLWVRVNTGKNTTGMALLVQVGNEWVQTGVRTKNSGNGSNFLTFYFEIPEKLITSDKTVFRLTSKNGLDVNAYHLWMFRLDLPEGQPLAEFLGFPINQEVGKVDHGLIPNGDFWQKPLILSNRPVEGAVLMQKIGNGYLIRSQLRLEDSLSMITALLNHSGLSNSASPIMAK